MSDQAIDRFFLERKEAWLKKNLKSSMDEDAIKAVKSECEITFSLEQWLPNAAKRAGQISLTTHPCRFSHPSAKKNKNGEVTSVIAQNKLENDGYLRFGNVQTDIDALGNSAALDVYKFLMLVMSDGETLMYHITNDTELAKKTLTIKSEGYDNLKEGFMTMAAINDENITSAKIKQVYFPLNNGSDNYHLLSILTNSGMIFEAKKRIDALRFLTEEEKTIRKEAKEAKLNNLYHDHQWKEIYNLTTIGYGGTKPQNISVLNSQNYGESRLFLSTPPMIKKRGLHFPTKNFFTQSLNPYHYRDLFLSLHKLYISPINNSKLRNKLDDYFSDLTKKDKDGQASSIVGRIIETVWAIRKISPEQYHEESSDLPQYQRIWLCEGYDNTTREKSDDWLDAVEKEMQQWLHNSYEKVMGKKAIKFGPAEFQYLADQVSINREALR